MTRYNNDISLLFLPTNSSPKIDRASEDDRKLQHFVALPFTTREATPAFIHWLAGA